MRHVLSFSLLSLSAATSMAQTTVPFVAGEQARAAVASVSAPNCSFLDKKLPKDTIVVAAGSYSGRKLNFQIDQSGHEATQFDVAVHSDKPVALLLGAYEPTVWSIGWTKGTQIVAVYATGYHRQAVAGLPKGTPIITTSQSGQGSCGYNYIGSDSGLEWVNPKSRQVFGLEASRVYNKAANGLLDIVESTRAKTDYVTSPDIKPESFRDLKAPLAGTAGLEAAVAKGLLRPVTAADIETVKAHYRANAAQSATRRPDIPPVAGAAPNAAPEVKIPSITTYRGYVVLKPLVFPAGLYGGNMATFIVPKGVSAPTGNPGHSTVIDLNKAASCTGVGCRM
jgi:hypothetical protein